MSPLLETVYPRFMELLPAPESPAAPLETPPSEIEGAAAEQTEAAPPVEVPPVEKTDFAAVGYHLRLNIAPEQLLEVAHVLDQANFAIDMVSGVDWPEKQQLEVVYDFIHFEDPARVMVRTLIPRDYPIIDTLSEIYPGANWHERETAEFFGIEFRGHPNPIHLLLPEDFVGYPLRKDFKPETEAS